MRRARRAVFHEDLGFRSRLERRFAAIHAEWIRFPWRMLREWPESGAYIGQWGVFGLHVAGKQIDKNCSWFPRTTRIVNAVPGLFNAGFSVLGPQTTIPPHRGTRTDLLRCHLGVVIPLASGILIDGEEHHWRAGKTLLFDDTLEHEAWNDSDEYKVVLMMDLQRPNHLRLSNSGDDDTAARDIRFYRTIFPDWN